VKLFIQTYGCQINEYDSDRIAQAMALMGYTPAKNIEDADLIVFNTCSVRDKAEQKVYSALGRMRELKEKKQHLIVAVGGCVAQQEKKQILRRAPYVDLVFGTHNIHKLPQMVLETQKAGTRTVETEFYRDPSHMESLGAGARIHGPKAYIAIMQGCNKVCSFCVVPHVRGREISRPADAILAEARDLVKRGVKEIMLLGQNVNSYGKTGAHEMSFPSLLSQINDLEGLERIRFTTSHPEDLSPDLITAYASLPKLCEHLHLPVQSGSDTVLQRMRRGYHLREYRDRIDRLRDRCPAIALSTDIIVGFPGENEQEFDQTLAMLREIEYDDAYVFVYSPRPHTTAAKIYQDDVPNAIKKRRLLEVLMLQGEISLRKNKATVGSVQEILIEGKAKLKRDQLMGRTRNNKIVNFLGGADQVGRLAPVRIAGATPNSLSGELLDRNVESRYLYSQGA
jgi:tRNA-2-methylthio-N6-dimethylallyladenosine synthase